MIISEKELKPKLGSRTALPFWDDEHISKEMLKCHLSFENDLASRKLETIQKTVESIIKETALKPGAKVLDLGCGPGLYTEEFAKRGFQVTGIDFSKRSIAYAKESADKNKLSIRYDYQDYLNLDFDNEFDLIIMIYLDYGALTDDERSILNPKIVKALKDKAYFIFDVYSGEHFKNSKNTSSMDEFPQGGFWSEKPYSLIKENFLYPEALADLTRYKVFQNDRVKTYHIWNYSFSLEALRDAFLPWGKVNKINFKLSTDSKIEETFFVSFLKEL